MDSTELIKQSISAPELMDMLGIEVIRGRIHCPFHNDSRPSMKVYNEHFHCFACGQHKDVISFIMGYLNLSFKDALQLLADKANISMDKDYDEKMKYIITRGEINEVTRQDMQSCIEYHKQLIDTYDDYLDINYKYGHLTDIYAEEKAKNEQLWLNLNQYGIDTVILGRPNVGKSSLLNALLEEDKAIVTDIEGTTRDIVEGTVRLDGITLNLIDTAGIHHSDDVIEQMGIDRSLKALEKAQLVILVLDATREMNEEDQTLLEMTERRTRIVVYNKNDQKQIDGALSISALNGDISPLTDAIKAMYEKELIASGMDTLNNERQIGLAMQAETSMKDALASLQAGMELDLVTIDLEKSWRALKEITGEVGREDLLDEIFSRFCLGK